MDRHNIVIVIIAIFIIGVVVFVIWAWHYPETALSPINYLERLDSSRRTNFYNSDDRDHIFPAGLELEAIWTDIRREGVSVYSTLNKQNYLDNYHLTLEPGMTQDWTTIPLRLFGRDVPAHLDKCPITAALLQNHSEIKSCLFSIMEPGKIITPHTGPYDGLLRYQLALEIPHLDDDEECYLHVGGERYEWIEGQGVLFDESQIHGAVNTTPHRRMVLLIDIERPYEYTALKLLNKGIISIMGIFH
jgi:beta-hydroxylase